MYPNRIKLIRLCQKDNKFSFLACSPPKFCRAKLWRELFKYCPFLLSPLKKWRLGGGCILKKFNVDKFLGREIYQQNKKAENAKRRATDEPYNS